MDGAQDSDEQRIPAEVDVAWAIDLNDTDGLNPERLDRPVLIWDGACGFCRRALLHMVAQLGDRVRYLTLQTATQYFSGLERRDLLRAVHFIEPDGRAFVGAAAVFRAYSWRPQGSFLMGIYRRSSIFAALSEWVYRQVATHRGFASRLFRLVPGW